DARQTVEVPIPIIAAKFDLETFQSVLVDPIFEHDRVTIFWFVAREFRIVKQIETSDQMPGEKFAGRVRNEKIGWILVAEINSGPRGGLEIEGEITTHEVPAIGGISGELEEIAVSIVHSQIVGGTAHQGG